MNSIIIIGNKGYKHIEVNDIIDIFTNNKIKYEYKS